MALGMILESGWRECDLVDCNYITIPGTPLRLPIQKGFDEVMQAFLRDVDAFIESCMNARGTSDEGSWTEDNSVYTSNHKGAVAVDWNWEDHPMGPDAIAGDCNAGWCGSDLIPGNQVPAMQELLAWYEGLIWWGASWNSPKDSMHFQAGYGTAGPKGAALIANFLNRKVRTDGYSTYRRGGVARGGGVTPPQAEAPKSGLTAEVLARVWDNRVPLWRYQQLVGPLLRFFKIVGADTIDERAMLLAQLGHESGGGKYQEEIASGDAYDTRTDLGNTPQVDGDGRKYKGRDFLQITGFSNYSNLSKWAYAQGLVDSPTYFLDHPYDLATDDFAFVGAAWYVMVARPQIMQLAQARDIREVTRLINGGYNGLADRQAFYDRALAANADLLDPISTDPWEELLTMKLNSFSIYRTPGEGPIEASVMLAALDAHGPHEPYIEAKARAGDKDAIWRVCLAASGKGADTSAGAVKQATDVLLSLGNTPAVQDALGRIALGLGKAPS